MKKKGTVLFIPHGGGPLPILGDPRHQELIKFLEKIKTRINKPSSIIIVSAQVMTAPSMQYVMVK